ncbi:hypothetical protein BpHYR1_017545 [Brachionus plicatilis]|uniref:Uncharacterized protein n=1 Tax=Brachionus plicatilis TaxID=10195 RepID=A0A3M7QVT8_BRAPC|nr:hypothetical protein BpHYR1_017545 [Brachionus plicatilis]
MFRSIKNIYPQIHYDLIEIIFSKFVVTSKRKYLKQFNRIKFKLKEFDLNFVKSLIAGVKAKLRKIGHDEKFDYM